MSGAASAAEDVQGILRLTTGLPDDAPPPSWASAQIFLRWCIQLSRSFVEPGGYVGNDSESAQNGYTRLVDRNRSIRESTVRIRRKSARLDVAVSDASLPSEPGSLLESLCFPKPTADFDQARLQRLRAGNFMGASISYNPSINESLTLGRTALRQSRFEH